MLRQPRCDHPPAEDVTWPKVPPRKVEHVGGAIILIANYKSIHDASLFRKIRRNLLLIWNDLNSRNPWAEGSGLEKSDGRFQAAISTGSASKRGSFISHAKPSNFSVKMPYQLTSNSYQAIPCFAACGIA